MSHRIENGITECGTNAPRGVTISYGQCELCPPWRDEQKLVNGLCFEHRVWGPPKNKRDPAAPPNSPPAFI